MATGLNWVWQNQITNPDRTASPIFQNYLVQLQKLIASSTTINVTNFNSGPGQLQEAINQAAAHGGGTIFIPAGNYKYDPVSLPAGKVQIVIIGQGDSTIITPNSQPPQGVGFFDVLGSNVTLSSFLIDGGVTTSVGLIYNQDFQGVTQNDPMAPSLSNGSSIWVHGPVTNFSVISLTIQHTRGYAILLDAAPGTISNAIISDSRFTNNRPNLFGIAAGQTNYGSWTGGIYVNGDGRNGGQGQVLKRLVVSNCQFTRGTGNQIWSHLYGLDELHEDFQVTDNYFLDVGLDAIEMGGVAGGAVLGNVGRRIGYIVTDDTSQSTPQWLANANATAIDSSGIVKGVLYNGNTFTSVNGGCVDLDGHGLSTVLGNMFRIPYPGDPEYDEDQIANTGPLNNGSASYGVNTNNSSNSQFGAAFLTISGNTFINLASGAIRLFAGRNCLVIGNTIAAPSPSRYPPVGMGPVGTGTYQRCVNNKITANNIDYDPPIAAPAVFEDDTISPFISGEVNTVCNNVPLTPPGTKAVEFQPSPNSSSVHYSEQVWFP
jgi:hypothetical protein